MKVSASHVDQRIEAAEHESLGAGIDRDPLADCHEELDPTHRARAIDHHEMTVDPLEHGERAIGIDRGDRDPPRPSWNRRIRCCPNRPSAGGGCRTLP